MHYERWAGDNSRSCVLLYRKVRVRYRNQMIVQSSTTRTMFIILYAIMLYSLIYFFFLLCFFFLTTYSSCPACTSFASTLFPAFITLLLPRVSPLSHFERLFHSSTHWLFIPFLLNVNPGGPHALHVGAQHRVVILSQIEDVDTTLSVPFRSVP